MTCIVGIAKEGTVYVGADSAGVDEQWNLVLRADRKVFVRDSMVFGFTSSFRMGQLLRYSLVVPESSATISLEDYMSTTFIDAVRSCLKLGGFAEKDKDAEKGGVFLIGYLGRLFCIQSDYQVAESLDGYYAIGYGANPALGALYATRDKEPEERIRIALEAAERFNVGVRGPFHMESVGNGD